MSADPKAPEPGRYRKRPVQVEAVRFDDNYEALKKVGYPVAQRMGRPAGRTDLWTEKSNAYCALESGDYIIREPNGKGFYPCAAAIFAATYEAVDGAEAVNAEPPATPEPAAPMPRIPDDRLAHVSAVELQKAVDCATLSDEGPVTLADRLALELVRTRSRESALRARVAELEARIAPLTAILDRAGRAMNDTHATVAGACEAMYVEEREKREAAEAALARANEALRAAFDAGWNAGSTFWAGAPGSPEPNTAFDAWCRTRDEAMRARGSAAQKPEGP